MMIWKKDGRRFLIFFRSYIHLLAKENLQRIMNGEEENFIGEEKFWKNILSRSQKISALSFIKDGVLEVIDEKNHDEYIKFSKKVDDRIIEIAEAYDEK